MRILLLVPLLMLLACAPGPGRAVGAPAMPTMAQSLEEIAAAITEADIVILGEVHDSAVHHRNQAQLLRALRPSAVVFEMLSPQQAVLVNQLSDRSEALREALAWDGSGWPDWALYQPVFAAMGAIPAYGMALPRETVNAAVKEGAAGMFGPQAADFGLTRPLEAEQQQEREAYQQAAHCNMLPLSLLPGMVEAQRLRDAAFARTTLQALEDTGGPVAVITGSGHARTDWGMPVALRHARPTASIVSLGQIEMSDEEASPDESLPYDLWLITEPTLREDPCAAFAKRGDAE